MDGTWGYGGLSLFNAGVLKCGPRPFALAQATIGGALLSSAAAIKAVSSLLRDCISIQRGWRGHITHKLVLVYQTYKQQSKKR